MASVKREAQAQILDIPYLVPGNGDVIVMSL